jgi:tetratricopeptide (TPR) repeat protein
MRHVLLTISLLAAFGAIPAAGHSPSFFLNRIEGMIFDENRRPLGDMYVELQNDVGSSVRTIRATSSGRFSFTGLSNGVFQVKILASGKNYLEQVQEVEFRPSVSGRSDDVMQLEFYMRPDRRREQPTPTTSPDAIFVQEIPDNAKKLYQAAIEDLDSKNAKGIEGLEKAVAAFPTYFDALNRLGKEYALRKQYAKAYPLLIRAVEVNPRSFTAYYFLGYSLYKVDQLEAAIKAAEFCTVIMPAMPEAYVLFGTVLRLHGDYPDAEKALRKAIALTNGKDIQAHWQLALLLNRMDRNNEAADELEAFLKLAPPDDANKKNAQDLVAKLRAAKKT